MMSLLTEFAPYANTNMCLTLRIQQRAVYDRQVTTLTMDKLFTNLEFNELFSFYTFTAQIMRMTEVLVNVILWDKLFFIMYKKN